MAEETPKPIILQILAEFDQAQKALDKVSAGITKVKADTVGLEEASTAAGNSQTATSEKVAAAATQSAAAVTAAGQEVSFADKNIAAAESMIAVASGDAAQAATAAAAAQVAGAEAVAESSTAEAEAVVAGAVESAAATDAFTTAMNVATATFAAMTAIVLVARAAYDGTIKPALDYADSVKKLSNATNDTVENTSHLIQMGARLGVTFADLEKASAMAATKGVSLTIDSLKKLSDEYLALPTPAARATFANDNFGRSSEKMAQFLQLGSAGIQEMMDHENKNVILTDANVKAAEDWNNNLADLQNNLKSTGLSIGNFLIPQLNNAMEAVNLLATAHQKESDALEQHNQDVAKSAENYQAYEAEMRRAAGVMGEYINTQGSLLDSNGKFIQAGFLMTKTEFDVAQGLYNIQDEGTRAAAAAKAFKAATSETVDPLIQESQVIEKMQNSNNGMVDSTKQLIDQINAENEAQKKLVSEGMTALKDSVDGAVGKSIDSYKERLQTLNVTLFTTSQKIADLNAKPYKTAADRAELAKLQTSFGETQDSIDKLTADFEKSSKTMIFNMLMTKASSDGLTQTEVDNLTTIALHWGLVDQATADTEKAVNAIDLSQGDATLSGLDSILASITGKPHNQDFTVHVNTFHNDYWNQGPGAAPGSSPSNPGSGNQIAPVGGGHAAGGSWVIPMVYGNEGFNLGQLGTASGGEKVTITPKNGAPAADGSGKTYNIFWNGDYKTLAAEMDRRDQVERLVHG